SRTVRAVKEQDAAQDVTEHGPAGIDPARLELCLSVFAELERLPPEHPDVLRVRRATSRLYKQVKRDRRSARRASVTAADREVTAATATGAPGRVDDETRGIPLRDTEPGAVVGTLKRPR